jgi:cytochrome c2
MKRIIIGTLAFGLLLVYACGNQGAESSATPAAATADQKETTENGNPSYDPKRGEGKFTKVELSEKLDAALASTGEKTFGVKCSSCHKLTEEKLVGPGWKGVTSRRAPEWIMNFITNTDAMLNKDPQAQAQLEICLVRMPNQNLSDDEARALLEYMRQNDGVK